MPTLVLPDTTLYYRTAGRGPTAFLLHGGPGLDASYFFPSMDPAKRFLRLVTPDLRGQGRSAPVDPETFTFESQCRDLEALRRASADGPVIVIGHSFGGFLALEYALRYPGSVSHLVLVDTGSAMDMPEEVMRMATEMGRGHPGATKAFMEAHYHDNETFRNGLMAFMPLYWRHFDAAKVDAMFAKTRFRHEIGSKFGPTMATWSVTSRLDRIKIPTLVLHGRHDFILPVAQAERLAAQIPAADLHVFEDSGHFPWVEQPRAFFAALRAWIDQQVPAARRVPAPAATPAL